jgi:hypothetical protein
MSVNDQAENGRRHQARGYPNIGRPSRISWQRCALEHHLEEVIKRLCRGRLLRITYLNRRQCRIERRPPLPQSRLELVQEPCFR